MSLKSDARGLLDRMVHDIHPSVLVPRHLAVGKNGIIAGGKEFRCEKVYVIGCGKAGASMAEAVERVLGPDRIEAGLVIAPSAQSSTQKIKILQSTHPFISEKSGQAGKAMLEFIKQIRKGDVVLCLLSGGGSALMARAEEGLRFEEKVEFLNALILKGVPEIEVNIVREALSALKGGKLAARLPGARIVNLLLLDNRGDVSAIASGPTVAPKEANALAVLEKHHIVAPERIVEILKKSRRPDLSAVRIHNVLIGSNETAKASLAAHASSMGARVHMMRGYFCGDVDQTAAELSARYREWHKKGKKGLNIVIAGGEVPVESAGRGRGGRNQHLAALMMQRLRGLSGMAFCAFATDGRDFMEGVRGALFTDQDIKKAGEGEIASALTAFTTYDLHSSLNTLIRGPLTGTNVSDVYLFLFRKG